MKLRNFMRNDFLNTGNTTLNELLRPPLDIKLEVPHHVYEGEEERPETWHFTLLLGMCELDWDLQTWVQYSLNQLRYTPAWFFYSWSPHYWGQKGNTNLAIRMARDSLANYKGQNKKLLQLKEFLKL